MLDLDEALRRCVGRKGGLIASMIAVLCAKKCRQVGDATVEDVECLIGLGQFGWHYCSRSRSSVPNNDARFAYPMATIRDDILASIIPSQISTHLDRVDCTAFVVCNMLDLVEIDHRESKDGGE